MEESGPNKESTMRKNIVAGNWKMNMDLAETSELLTHLKMQLVKEPTAEVYVAPPFTSLYHAFQTLKDTPIKVAAQNVHYEKKGAFTGEISAQMLQSVGVVTVIIGHSERRAQFNETGEILAKKVSAAIDAGMTVIFCFGEELKERKEESHFDVVKNQLEEGIFHLKAESWEKVILAYEPVWAIGTGETASPEQAQEVHAFVRKAIADKYDTQVAQNVSILYGGSVKADNAREIFGKEDVDGGLIGGASLNAIDFLAIVNSFE